MVRYAILNWRDRELVTDLAEFQEFDDDEFYDEFYDDEFDFDNGENAYCPMEGDDMVERIQNLEPRMLFQDDVNKALCKKGLELLSEIMEKANDINGIQGNYFELCNIFWPVEGSDMVERIQNLEQRQLFQDDNNNKELCKKGLELLSEIMEKAEDINGIQGNYLELCNIFKEIHNN